MRWLAALPFRVVATGAALVVTAVRTGSASVNLLFVVPVVSGRSPAILRGAAHLVLGLFLLPLLAVARERPDDRAGETPYAPTRSRSDDSPRGGGVILVGPVPILFGTWRGLSSRARWALAITGGVVLGVAGVGGALLR